MEMQCAACGSLVRMRANSLGEVNCSKCGADLLGTPTEAQVNAWRNYDPRPHLAPFVIVGTLLIGGALYGAWKFVSAREARKHPPAQAATAGGKTPANDDGKAIRINQMFDLWKDYETNPLAFKKKYQGQQVVVLAPRVVGIEKGNRGNFWNRDDLRVSIWPMPRSNRGGAVFGDPSDAWERMQESNVRGSQPAHERGQINCIFDSTWVDFFSKINLREQQLPHPLRITGNFRDYGHAAADSFSFFTMTDCTATWDDSPAR